MIILIVKITFPKIYYLLIEANKKALKWVSADPIIKSWRQTFQKFKTKKGARCSVENLLKRAKQFNQLMA